MLKIIISPAKKMNILEDFPCPLTSPVFLQKAEKLQSILRSMEPSELKTLWKCSDRLTQLNYERLRTYTLDRNLTPALLSYEGIQYQHIAPSVFTDPQWTYVLSHLRILSGFYGILAPGDGVIPYRLEMQARLKTAHAQDLYGYWGDKLYTALVEDGMTELINLASAEYSKAVLPHAESDAAHQIRCITCTFGEMVNGKVRQKGTQAKIARGEMVRWMAQMQIERAEDLRSFSELGYTFHPELSSEEEFVFLKS